MIDTHPNPTADRIRALDPAAGPMPTMALYAGALARQSRDGVAVELDLRYGPDERHRVDVYRPEGRCEGRTILVFLHGGGFVRGDKSMRSNLGWWGAREGFVVALPNYRLAPATRWPGGPEDVARLCGWLAVEAAGLGGDARRIVLSGESAGAAHVAAAGLIEAFRPAACPAIRGLALVSGPYDAMLEGRARRALGIPTPDPRNDAYFGPTADDWRDGSIIDRIDAAPLPVWIAFAERDLLPMQVQAGQLFAALVRRHGFDPDIDRLDGHNHFSPACSVGTTDTAFADRLAAFVRAASGTT